MARPWMPLYVGDYLGDTRHLTLEQHGAYLLLIMHYWAHGGLPTETKAIRRIIGVESSDKRHQWRSICLAIAPLFVQPGWRHKRIDAELEKHEIIRTKRKMAGQKGGLVSRGKTSLDRYITQANAKQTGHQPQPPIDSFFLKEPMRKFAEEGASELRKVIVAKGWNR